MPIFQNINSLNKMKNYLFLISLSFLLSLSSETFANSKEKDKEKKSSIGEYEGFEGKKFKGLKYQSFYITMPDGVDIAVDLYLPKNLKKDDKLPLVFELTRYTRSFRLNNPYHWLKKAFVLKGFTEQMKYFTSHGYAFMRIDARGSGASYGIREMEFANPEINDANAIIDWIIDQPWSNGNVGATGVSYSGTTAELVVKNQHPNLKASAPMYSIFDLYEDIVFPGGVKHSPFIELWGGFTLDLDKGVYDKFGKKAGRILSGANNVDADKKRLRAEEAKKIHLQNFDIFSSMSKMTYRDEKDPQNGKKIDEFSAHQYIQKIENSPTPMYRFTGWYDGGLQNSTLKGFASTKNTKKVIVGPWDHGNAQNISPFAASNKVDFDINGELVRYFDYHLKGVNNGIDEEPAVHYFTMGEEKWKSSKVWPLENEKRKQFFISNDFKLNQETPNYNIAKNEYKVDYDAGTGGGARWNSLTTLYRYEEKIGYFDRAEQDKKLVVFESDPLKKNTEVTGHPLVKLFVASDTTDANIFVYLEEVTKEGKVIYVTEGLLRALHRKYDENYEGDYKKHGPYRTYNEADAKPMKIGEPEELFFELLPTSYMFSEGSKIRVAIAGADKDHFEAPDAKPSKIEIFSGKNYPSYIDLPIIE
jgi:uncharacterized protein